MKDEDIKKNWEEFVSLLRSTKREGIEGLISYLDTKTDFKIDPASTRYHLNCKGGLLQHTLNVYYVMRDDFKTFIDIFKIPEDSVIIVALLHDICKANTYIVETRNVKKDNEWVQEPYYRVDDPFPFGHGEKSVTIAQDYIKLSNLEKMMIRWHMGFANVPQHDIMTSEAFNKCPQVSILNFADEVATFMLECNDGGFEKYSRAGFRNLFVGRSVTESLDMLNNIVIDGMKYKRAPIDANVDGVNIIEINNDGQMVKVYAPHKDGLPF